MVVGICRIELSLPANDSLKGKRAMLRRILDRGRHKFNAAFSEVDHLDHHRRATIGVAVVSNDGRHAQSMIDTIVSFVSTISEAQVVGRSSELVHVSDELDERGSFDDFAEDDDPR